MATRLRTDQEFLNPVINNGRCVELLKILGYLRENKNHLKNHQLTSKALQRWMWKYYPSATIGSKYDNVTGPFKDHKKLFNMPSRLLSTWVDITSNWSDKHRIGLTMHHMILDQLPVHNVELVAWRASSRSWRSIKWKPWMIPNQLRWKAKHWLIWILWCIFELERETVRDTHFIALMGHFIDFLRNVTIFRTVDSSIGCWHMHVVKTTKLQFCLTLAYAGSLVRHIDFTLGQNRLKEKFRPSSQLLYGSLLQCIYNDLVIFSRNQEYHLAHVPMVPSEQQKADLHAISRNVSPL